MHSTSISPACRVLSSITAAHCCCCGLMGQKDGQMLHRFSDPAPHAGSISKTYIAMI